MFNRNGKKKRKKCFVFNIMKSGNFSVYLHYFISKKLRHKCFTLLCLNSKYDSSSDESDLNDFTDLENISKSDTNILTENEDNLSHYNNVEHNNNWENGTFTQFYNSKESHHNDKILHPRKQIPVLKLNDEKNTNPTVESNNNKKKYYLSKK